MAGVQARIDRWAAIRWPGGQLGARPVEELASGLLDELDTLYM
jgi:hypothetical protein